MLLLSAACCAVLAPPHDVLRLLLWFCCWPLPLWLRMKLCRASASTSAHDGTDN
jgi:hypothetical protein